MCEGVGVGVGKAELEIVGLAWTGLAGEQLVELFVKFFGVQKWREYAPQIFIGFVESNWAGCLWAFYVLGNQPLDLFYFPPETEYPPLSSPHPPLPSSLTSSVSPP